MKLHQISFRENDYFADDTQLSTAKEVIKAIKAKKQTVIRVFSKGRERVTEVLSRVKKKKEI